MINSVELSSKKSVNLLFLQLFSLLFLGCLILGCSQNKKAFPDPLDKQIGFSREDIKKAMVADKTKKNERFDNQKNIVPLPRTSRMLSVPTPPAVGNEKLISFSATEQVPLKDVLIELGRVSKIDIDIDPNISGGVIINAKNRPLKEILERICNMGNLRYSYENNVLHFERDLPYAKNYVVDYIIGDNLWSEVESNLAKVVAINSGGSTAISSNKVAGIITVYANSKKQSEAEKYLEDVRKNFSAQVLIEAKVIEVTLKDNFKTGIDWSWGKFKIAGGGASIADGATSAVSFALPAPRKLFGSDISATISALEEFGNVRAISSPRINALNNQKAVLNFTDQLIYFTVQIQTDTALSATTAAAGNTKTTITSTKHEEPIGVELTIIPSINLKTNEVTLNVHPKLSSKGTLVNDPAKIVDPNNPNNPTLQNTVPQINTRELTTTMKVESGGTLVIGGLMKDESDNTDMGVPFLSRIPILGWAFKSVTKNSKVVETVIFIKATIVNSGSGVDKLDRDFHDNFDTNKRSLFN